MFSKASHTTQAPQTGSVNMPIQVSVCTGTCMSVQVCVQVCLHMWRPEDQLDHNVTQALSIMFYETGLLTGLELTKTARRVD